MSVPSPTSPPADFGAPALRRARRAARRLARAARGREGDGHALVAVALACALATALGACARDADPPSRGAAGAPAAEFLLAAGDSTYWIATGESGPRVRSAPLLLARWDGRLHEIYVADEDRSFSEAVFAVQRVFRRDLLTGDSTALVADTTIPGLALRYAEEHPHERPLEPGEEPEGEPSVTATSEVALLDVHGPYLTVERYLDVDGVPGRHEHRVARQVLDLRTGARVSVATLFGEASAATLVAEGRRRLADARDSLRAAAADESGPAGRAARAALGGLRFDPASFGLAAIDGRPAVQFVALGQDGDGRAVTLPLLPVVAPAPAPTWWTREVDGTLPRWSRDSSEARWRVGPLELRARTAEGGRMLLHAARSEPAASGGRRPGGGARRAAGPQWTIGTVGTPVHQLLPLDVPGAPGGAARDEVARATLRRALRRAFDASAAYGETMVAVGHRVAPSAPGAGPVPRVVHVARRAAAAPRSLRPTVLRSTHRALLRPASRAVHAPDRR